VLGGNPNVLRAMLATYPYLKAREDEEVVKNVGGPINVSCWSGDAFHVTKVSVVDAFAKMIHNERNSSA